MFRILSAQRTKSTPRLVFHHAVQAFLDALAETADGALGTAYLFADLLHAVALEAQLQDLAVGSLKSVKDLFHGFGEHGRFQRRRFTVNPCKTISGPFARTCRLLFPVRVAPLRKQILTLLVAFADGDDGQQTPQVVPIHDIEFPGRLAAKERPVHRLHHIFRIELGPKLGIEPRTSQTNEPAGEALDDLPGGSVVSFAEALHQVDKRDLSTHEWRRRKDWKNRQMRSHYCRRSRGIATCLTRERS